MPLLPETKSNLIVRLQRSTDEEARREFVELYEPFIYRFARRRGLQEADSRELVQRVMWSVAKAVERLFRIARNELIDLIKQTQRGQGGGGTTQLTVLSEQMDPSCERVDAHLDYRREVFRHAAAHVKHAVQAATWEAFWRSSVKNVPVAQVAQELGITPGAVYIARSRVIARLRDVVQQLEAGDAL